MTPRQRQDYRALRDAGISAATAYAMTRTELDDAAAERVDDLTGRERAEWTERGYTMRAELRPDYTETPEDMGIGTFTDTPGPDTIPNTKRGDRDSRSDYRHFRPDYGIAERIDDNRRRGMSRQDARDRAYQDARVDLIRAHESAPAVLVVTASRAAVELGRAALGGIETNPDPGLPYGIAERQRDQYIAEELADLADEATQQARETRPALAAALAVDPENAEELAEYAELHPYPQP